jgi:hypothetical protein
MHRVANDSITVTVGDIGSMDEMIRPSWEDRIIEAVTLQDV